MTPHLTRRITAALTTAALAVGLTVTAAPAASAEDVPAVTITPLRSAAAGTGPYSAAFSPDGKFLATADRDSKTVSVFTVNQVTGEPSGRVTAATGTGPQSVAFSPDGRFLATADNGNNVVSVFTVDQATGQPSGRLTASSGINPRSVAWSPDGQHLATADYNSNVVSVFTVDPVTGQPSGRVAAATDRYPNSVAWSPDGKFLATANYQSSVISVFTVDHATGQPGGRVAAATGAKPYSVAWSPDGRHLATADYGSNAVSLFSVAPYIAPLTAESGGSISVAVDSMLSLTMADSDVALSGVTGAADTSEPDSQMAYVVTTNNTAGYSVEITADQESLTGATPSNTDVIPVSAITASQDSTGKLSAATPVQLHNQDKRSIEAGDQFVVGFTADIPFVNADTYTGTVTLTATAK